MVYLNSVFNTKISTAVSLHYSKSPGSQDVTEHNFWLISSEWISRNNERTHSGQPLDQGAT